MPKSALNPFMWFFAAIVALITTFVIAMVALRSLPYGLLRLILVMLPIFPAIGAGYSLARGVGRLDELQKRIQLEALAFSLATTSFLALGIGLLQYYASLNFNAIFILLFSVLSWGIGVHAATRRYQ